MDPLYEKGAELPQLLHVTGRQDACAVYFFIWERIEKVEEVQTGNAIRLRAAVVSKRVHIRSKAS